MKNYRNPSPAGQKSLSCQKCMNNSGFNQLDHNCLPNNDSITQNSGCLIIIPIWNITYSVWEALQEIKKVIFPFPQNTLNGNLCKTNTVLLNSYTLISQGDFRDRIWNAGSNHIAVSCNGWTTSGALNTQWLQLFPWKESDDQPRQRIKKQRHYFANKGLSSQDYGFSSGHVWDVRAGLWRKLSAKKLMLLNCDVEYSWESLGLQGDPTSPS